MKYLFVIPIALAVACTTSDTENGTADDADTSVPDTTPEQEYIYGDATIRSMQVMVMESFPVQVKVQLSGDLGDGCTSLFEIEKEMMADTFNISVTTQRPKDAICTQQLVSFQETTDLEVRGLEKGTYFVKAGDITRSFTLEVDNEMK